MQPHTALGFKQEDVDRTKPKIYFESRELFFQMIYEH